MYTYDARIRYSETDCENKLTPEGLLNYFQDASTFQSEDLGVGVKYMLERRLVWALNAWQIDVEKYPEIGERVQVGTLPYEFRGFIGFRNFWMNDSKGRRLAAANSIWTLLNLETGKPVRPMREMLDGYGTGEKIEMEYLPRKIAVPEDGIAGSHIEKIKSGIVRLEKPEILITKQHLDANRHVNNGQYVKMALAYLEEGLTLKRIRAEYKKQAYAGDVFYPIVYQKENVYTIGLNNKEGEPYAVVELTAVIGSTRRYGSKAAKKEQI